MKLESWQALSEMLRFELEDWRERLKEMDRMLSVMKEAGTFVPSEGVESPDDDGVAETPGACYPEAEKVVLEWSRRLGEEDREWCNRMLAGLQWYDSAFAKDSGTEYDNRALKFLDDVQAAYMAARR